MSKYDTNDITRFISMIAGLEKSCERPGWATLILKYGAPMREILPLPKRMKRGKMGHCYTNSGRIWGYHGYLLCAEGYAMSGGLGFPLLHGWLVRPDTGAVIDPTWKDGVAYYGIAFQRQFTRWAQTESHHYGIMENYCPAIMDRIMKIIKGKRSAARAFHPINHNLIVKEANGSRRNIEEKQPV